MFADPQVCGRIAGKATAVVGGHALDHLHNGPLKHDALAEGHPKEACRYSDGEINMPRMRGCRGRP